MSAKILVEHYTTYKPGDYSDEKSVSPFVFKKLWGVKEPTLEIGSKKHGDVCLTFKDDGSIDIIYYSPRIDIDAEGVIPAHLTLNP